MSPTASARITTSVCRIRSSARTTHGTITVTGGTFVNYDPSTGDDNLGGSFVADGYKVVSETQSTGDVWYTVVAE